MEEYIIWARHNEYHEVMSIINYILENDSSIEIAHLDAEIIKRLRDELEDNEGKNVTSWQYNMIISILLNFVPGEIKKY